VVSSTHRPYFTPGKAPVPILQEAVTHPSTYCGDQTRTGVFNVVCINCYTKYKIQTDGRGGRAIRTLLSRGEVFKQI